MSKKSKIFSIVTSSTGEHVSIGNNELDHALSKHFRIPKIKLVEIIEQILKDPTVVYVENPPNELIKCYHLFYRLDDGGYLVVVVKILPEGAYFSTIYPTGKTIRPPHKKLRRLK